MNRLILFLLFLYITYTESTLTSLNEMKTTITPEMDTMIERIYLEQKEKLSESQALVMAVIGTELK